MTTEESLWVIASELQKIRAALETLQSSLTRMTLVLLPDPPKEAA